MGSLSHGRKDCESLSPKDYGCDGTQSDVTQVNGICDQILRVFEVLVQSGRSANALSAVLRRPFCKEERSLAGMAQEQESWCYK